MAVTVWERSVPIWGRAEPGEKVTVTLGEKSVSDTADKDGKWNVKLEGLAPGSGKEMTVAGKNTLTLRLHNPHHFGGMFRRPFLYRPVGE